MSSRRDFLKNTCGICLAIGGAGMLSALLQSCGAIPMVKASPVDKKVSVPLSSFTDKQPYVLVRIASLENDILLVKKKDGTFTALYMECTHQNQPLTVTGNGLHCPTHGSSFDLDGNVTQSPATQPLKKYPAAASGENVLITLN
jgi:nitrite reductase/ring-hydroxylating ferredoxin subunit